MSTAEMIRTEVKPRLGPHPSWAELREESRALCIAWSDLAGRAQTGTSGSCAIDAERRDEYVKSGLFFQF